MYLLDTNILSPLLTADPPEQLRHRFSRMPRRALYTSAINLGEMLYGLFKGRKGPAYFHRLSRLFDWVQILSFDSSCAETYARLRTELELAGTPIHHLDLMIASVALGNDLILLTANERHFSRVPGLAIENWLRGS